MSMFDKNNTKKSLRATNIELQGRDISIAANDGNIYMRDVDNLYNLRIEKLINNSPTAKRCSNMMAKYIVGNGIANEIVINKKGETLNDIADLASNEISTQYGVFFFTSWTIDIDYDQLKPKFVPTNLKVLDSIPLAKSKVDDDGFPGKIYQLNMIARKEQFKKVDKETTWFYPYNDNPKVILAQMKNDCKMKGILEPTPADLVQNYRGQVYYLNLTSKYHYALPPWDSVYDDMDTEYRISRYNNTQARGGWLGKTIIKKFGGDEDDDDSFNKTLKANLGSENAADVMVVDIPEGTTDDLAKSFVVDQLKPQFDDKLFESTKKSLRENIAGNFNNAPTVLLFSADGSLFGANSEMYLQAKRFYWEQNEYERFKLEKTLSKLTGLEITFIPIKGVE